MDSDDDFSDDEIVGDFSVDDGRARLLHGKVLQHRMIKLPTRGKKTGHSQEAGMPKIILTPTKAHYW